MEVRIRLQKAGNKSTKGRYNYRVVAISRAKARDSRHLEILGHYDASKNPAIFQVNQEKIDKWLNNGAQMSDTVRTLIKKSNKAAVEA